MKFLHYLIVIPLIAVAVWAIIGVEAGGIHFPYGPEEGFKAQYVLAVFLLLGYLLGRIGAWFGYSPLRRDLRMQRRTNRALNKEQAKLNETVTGLKRDIIGMQAKAQQENSDKKPEGRWWQRLKVPTKKG